MDVSSDADASAASDAASAASDAASAASLPASASLETGVTALPPRFLSGAGSGFKRPLFHDDSPIMEAASSLPVSLPFAAPRPSSPPGRWISIAPRGEAPARKRPKTCDTVDAVIAWSGHLSPGAEDMPSGAAAAMTAVNVLGSGAPRAPPASSDPGYAYVEVVRGKKREHLPAVACRECAKFYEATGTWGGGAAQLSCGHAQLLDKAGRHRRAHAHAAAASILAAAATPSFPLPSYCCHRPITSLLRPPAARSSLRAFLTSVHLLGLRTCDRRHRRAFGT